MESETKKKNLAYYLKMGWPIFPCKAGGKEPLTLHGFKEASLDPEQVAAWHNQHPDANWAMRTGDTREGGAGLVVVDIDVKSGGPATWEHLRKQHSQPLQTVTVRTGGGGRHLFFKYPAGHVIKNRTAAWPGIDIRANGGYVIIPPSVTGAPYRFELSTADTEISELPEWLLAKLDSRPKAPEPEALPDAPDQQATDLKSALSMLNALKPERVENYQSWLEVGMSLYALGQEGLVAWDSWSKKSDKWEPGACAQKWQTFTPDYLVASKITFASLIHWAEEDGCTPFIRPAPRKTKPSHYAKTLAAFGYEFSVNDMNDMLYINGNRMNDLLMSKIMTDLREHDYKSREVALDAISSMALEHKFHPIKDYLNSLEWEGYQDGEAWTGIDHIAHLCEYMQDKDGLFPHIFRKWLIGSVGRILGAPAGQQHPMLVLDGPQGIGKSRFVGWLGSPLPAFRIQNAINTNDKDFLILLCSKWIWEVEELGATLRKSDIESLKAFLSKEVINVRKPYGRDEIVKPATASFIGTINSSGGFLADPTGSRRFRVCTLTSIDWDYDRYIDINQVWAQAVGLFRAGETWELDKELQAKMVEINNRYEVDDPLAFDLFDTYNVDPQKTDQYTATAQIIHRLRVDGKLVGGDDRHHAQRIAHILTRLGCEKDNIRINGQRTRVWRGVWLRF